MMQPRELAITIIHKTDQLRIAMIKEKVLL